MNQLRATLRAVCFVVPMELVAHRTTPLTPAEWITAFMVVTLAAMFGWPSGGPDLAGDLRDARAEAWRERQRADFERQQRIAMAATLKETAALLEATTKELAKARAPR